MRLYWYSGMSAALATGVVAYAFNQRANFYSAMVYLSQNNLSLMILINLVLLIYGSFVWGLQRLCYGPLRPIEIEQLYEKAWFAVTETCLAMTIFREEVGAWFLVMFTALVTGKIWQWIGEGRVEILEQQPPANPRLFHTRLSASLLLSMAYDIWLFVYTVNAVIRQARPNMMVMFLFEFAILATCSFRTLARYALSLVEADIVKKQTRHRLADRRRQVREEALDIMRRRESGDSAEAEAARQEEVPNPDDVEEMDIEVPGWESKGQWVLGLDLFTDFIKLGVYTAFFAILMRFYGLPIHIMRDLFMTARSFVKRLGALLRYRKALQDMNKYPDATEEELGRENTCIICREDMRPWDPASGAIERSRPKKLPCGHILHFGCLKSWLERQQVCPTCRRPVVLDRAGRIGDAGAGGAAAPMGNAQPPAPGQPAPGNGAANVGAAPRAPGGGGGAGGHGDGGNMRVFQLGPLRLGFAQGNPRDLNIHDMAQRMRNADGGANAAAPAPGAATPAIADTVPGTPGVNGLVNNTAETQAQLHRIAQRIQADMQALQNTHASLQSLYALTAELDRLNQIQQQSQLGLGPQPGQATTSHGLAYQQPLPQPFPASFPSFPQRTGTPVMTRHGGSSYSDAIPAGSPDLPDGVTIPPGWSLLPLQRLPSQTQAPWSANNLPPQPFGPPPGAAFGAHSPVPGGEAPTGAGQNPAMFGYVAGASSRSEGSSSRAVSGESQPVQTRSQAEPGHPEVAAPTPVMPNWGGAAQLFARGENGHGSTESTEPPRESADPKAPESQSSEEDSDEAEEHAESSGGGEAKGKAKAATVEDGDGDE